MRIVRLLQEALVPLLILVFLGSLAVAAWAQNLSAVAAQGRYPALDPELYQRVVHNYPNTSPDR